jgi:N-acyl-D-aspartate/D-glutamate deacylase
VFRRSPKKREASVLIRDVRLFDGRGQVEGSRDVEIRDGRLHDIREHRRAGSTPDVL